MARPEPPSTTMLPISNIQEQTASTETGQQSERFRQPERLALTLDFASGTEQSNLTQNTHPHVLFSPIHYEPGYAYPLLVWLHGSGGDERQVMRIMPTVSMRNYVAVAPQGTEIELEDQPPHLGESVRKPVSNAWSQLDVASILRGSRRQKAFHDWPASDRGLMEAEQRIFDCITTAAQRCNIASNRVFIAGFGSGGTMALRMALLNPEHFAGVISLGGPFPLRNQVLHRWSAARSLNVFLGAGRASTVFSPEAACQSLELLHTAGVPVTVREYECGQELIPAMLQDMNRWMMEIVCG